MEGKEGRTELTEEDDEGEGEGGEGGGGGAEKWEWRVVGGDSTGSDAFWPVWRPVVIKMEKNKGPVR